MDFKIIKLDQISTKGYKVRFETGLEDIEDLKESIKKNGLIRYTDDRRWNTQMIADGIRR